MSGETENNVSGWTVDTLKAHIDSLRATDTKNIDARFVAAEERTTLALTAADRAVVKAETATEKRFDAVNEFRATLADQAATLMPRAEAEIRLGSLSAQIDELRGTRRGGIQAAWGVTIAVISLAVSIVVAIVLILKG